jgi:hypothetical protein
VDLEVRRVVRQFCWGLKRGCWVFVCDAVDLSRFYLDPNRLLIGGKYVWVGVVVFWVKSFVGVFCVVFLGWVGWVWPGNVGGEALGVTFQFRWNSGKTYNFTLKTASGNIYTYVDTAD